MSRNRNGKYTFSGKPCDIEYRLERAQSLINRLESCLRSIDPTALGDGKEIVDLADELPKLFHRVKEIHERAPQKRVHVKRAAPGQVKKKAKKKTRRVKQAKQNVIDSQAVFEAGFKPVIAAPTPMCEAGLKPANLSSLPGSA